jgi:hypothetical protein
VRYLLLVGLGLSALSLIMMPGCSKKVPKRWSDLGLPTDGLQKVLKETDEHGYYADHVGHDVAAFWEKVSTAIQRAGYTPACSEFDGLIKGFSKGNDRIVVKIDTLSGSTDGLLALAIFDEQGKDPLLHGVCFGKYKQVGETKTFRPGHPGEAAAVEPPSMPSRPVGR